MGTRTNTGAPLFDTLLSYFYISIKENGVVSIAFRALRKLTI